MEEMRHFDNFKESQVILRVVGFWPMPAGLPRLCTVLHQAYSVLLFLAFYTAYPVLEVIDFSMSLGNLDTLTQNVCLTGTHIGGVLKVLLIILKKKKIMECFHSFDHVMSGVSSANNRPDHQREAVEIIMSTKAKSDRLRKIFLSGVSLCGVFCAAYPLLDMSILGRHFPYRAWLPAPLAELTLFVYCYKTLAIFVLALVILGVDHLCVELILHLTAQTRVLRKSIRALGERYDPSRQPGGPATALAVQSSSCDCQQDEKWNNITYQHFKKCVVHHQYILKMAQEIDSLFSNIILVQFFLSITGLCLSCLQVTIRKFDGVLVAMTAYFFCNLMEILLYCVYANKLTIESEKLGRAAYESMWLSLDQKLRKALIIFMERAKIPIYISAGGFFKLSLDTFTQILSKSYSMLVILRNFICEKNC